MGTLRLSLVLGLLLLPAAVRAEDHDGDLASGGNFSPQSTLFGGYFSYAQVIESVLKTDAESGRLSWVLDFSYHLGSHKGATRTQLTALGGARCTFHLGEPRDPPRLGDTRVFVQVLLGVVHTRDKDESERVTDTGFAVAPGGAFEVSVMEHGAVRLQGDWVIAGGDKSFGRVSLGFVLRFRKKH